MLALFMTALTLSAQAETVSGTMLDDSGNPTSGAIQFLDAAGSWHGEGWSDHTGAFSVDLPDGDYYAVSRFTHGVIDDVWDGVDGTPCQNMTCDINALGTPVNVTSGTPVSGINFVLDAIPGGGHMLSGNISAGGNPAAYAGVVIMNALGHYIGELRADRHGHWVSNPLPDDDYYIRTHVEPAGFARELWSGGEPNYVCPSIYDCDNPVEVLVYGAAVTIDNAGVGHLDFDLDATDPARSVSGFIHDGGIPINNVWVDLYDEYGEHMGSRNTDIDGLYHFSNLPDDGRTFRVFVSGPPRGYDTALFNGVACPQWACDPVADGSPVSLGSIGNDIELPYIGSERIHGIVAMDGTGEGVSSAHGHFGVQFWDDAGNQLGETHVEDNGRYQIILADWGYGPGDYTLLTANDPNYHGLINEDNDGNLCMYDCTPQTSGASVITVDASDSVRVDFNLQAGKQVSGTVTAENGGAPLGDIEICAARQSDGWYVGCAWTGADGNYVLGGLADSNELVVFVNNPNNQPYLPEQWNDDPCCDYNNADLVDVTGGDVAGIDFALGDAFSVSGTLSVDDGSGAVPLVNDAEVWVFDLSGNQVSGGQVDENGAWTTFLPPGDYLFYFQPYKPAAYDGYVSEFHDGTPCAELQCFGWDFVSHVTPLTIGFDTSGIDATLEPGAVFVGQITDENTGAPIADARVIFYDDLSIQNETYFTEYFMIADGNGDFRTPPLPPKAYSVFSTGYVVGYSREYWSDQKCAPLDCDDAIANRTVEVPVAGEFLDVSMDLVQRVNLSGTVLDPDGNPLDGVPVTVRDAAGQAIETVWTGPDGSYVSDLFQNDAPRGHSGGDYLVTARGEDFGFHAQIYGDPGNGESNVECPFETCATSAPVTPLSTLDGQDRTDINFQFTARDLSTVSGSITDPEGNPAGGAVAFMDPAGNNYADAWTDGDGNFSIELQDGTYWAVTRYTYGVIDDAWDGIDGAACVNLTCDIMAVGTPIVVSGGAPVNGIDFVLDPIPGGGYRLAGSVFAGGQPAAETTVIILNSEGSYLGEVRADSNGDWTSNPLADDGYYVVTRGEPAGYARELWSGGEPNYVCSPVNVCDDPTVITTQGSAIIINGADETGIDFDLDAPATATSISGQVNDTGVPLPNVWVELHDQDYNYYGSRQTDVDGRFFFYDLPDDGRTFRVFVSGPTHGYDTALFNGVPCPQWACDPVADGTPVNVGSTDIDIQLPYIGGTRIAGFVRHADTGQGISSSHGYMAVTLWDDQGNYLGETATDSAGIYQFVLSDWGLGAGDYTLVTAHDQGYHGLVNEDSDGTQCLDDCNPQVMGTTPISVTEGGLAFVNFSLQPVLAIRGQVTDAVSGAPIAGVQLDIWDGAGSYIRSASTDEQGRYLMPLAGDGDYYLFTPIYAIPAPYLPEVWDGATGTYCDFNACDILAAGTAISVTGSDVDNVDFDLDQGFTLSGLVTEAGSGSALEGVGVCVHRPDGSFTGACGTSDASGQYVTGALPSGTDYVPYAIGDEQGYKRQVYVGVDCWANQCDFSAGTPVTLGPDATGIDFALNPGASVSGTITDTSAAPIAGVDVMLLDTNCQWITGMQTDVNGQYSLGGLGAGSFHVFVDSGYLGYVPEIYPDFKALDPCAASQGVIGGQLLALGEGDNLAGIDMALDEGASISGFISGPGGLLGTAQAQARLYNEAGDQLTVRYNTEPDASYLLGGLLPGTYYVVLSSNGQGLVDELYDDVPCPRFSCDSELGVPVVVTPGDVVTGIDAELVPGALITGQVFLPDGLTGAAQYSIAFYDADGDYAGYAVTDVSGAYTSATAFPDGTYYAANQFRINAGEYSPPEGGFMPLAWPDRACGEPCDFLLGDPIVISGTAPVTGIDFQLQNGSTIQGAVTAQVGGAPIAGVKVLVLDAEDGSLVRSVSTGGSGQYSFTGLTLGEYYVRTSNQFGYEDRLFAGVSCNPFCDLASGTPVDLAVDGQVATANFALALTPTITGTVVNAVAAPVGGVLVTAYDTLGSAVASANTAADGSYSLGNLYAGNFYVATSNGAGYVDALWQDNDCLPGCDPTVGNPVALSAGSTATGIDLVLGSASAITGAVTNNGNPLSGVRVEVYRDTGAFVGSTIADTNGVYQVGSLSTGNYHVVTRNQFGYVDEGAGGEVCKATCSPLSTQLVSVPLNTAVSVDFALDEGAEIAGVVTDTAANSLQSVSVRAFNSAGQAVGTASTGPAGGYRIVGLASGDVYLRTENGSGYRNQRFDGLACDAACDVLAGTPVSVTAGAESTADFQLALGGSLAGRVSNLAAATALAGVQVQVFDAAGLLAGFDITDGTGDWSVTGLDDGDYRVRTINSLGYIDQVLGGDSCSPEPCLVAGGSAVTIASSHETGVDFTLEQGEAISGVATDGFGVPLPTGVAKVFSATGQLVKEGGIFSGSFLVNGLADGSYHMLVTNSSGLVDQLWSDLPCPGGSCDVTAGTEIVVGPGSAQPAAVQFMMAAGRGAKTHALDGSSRLSFELDRGTLIRGSVRDEAGNALKLATVFFFSEDGALAGQATTDGLGDFVSPASFPEGLYYAATSAPGLGGIGNGYIDEIFDGTACDGECDPASTDPALMTAIGIGEPGADPAAVHFVLGLPRTISGAVTVANSATPLAGADVTLFHSDGSVAGSMATDGQGEYRFEGLPSGTYFALAGHASGDFSTVLFDAIDCTDGTCDVTAGMPISLSDGDAAGINFELADISCLFNDEPGQPDSDGDGTVDACEANPPEVSNRAWLAPGVLVGDGAVIERNVTVLDDAVIGAWNILRRNATIGARCLLASEVEVDQSATLGEDCVIGARTFIGRGAKLGAGVTVGADTVIDERADIGAGAVIGNNVTIGDKARISEGVCIADHTVIAARERVSESNCF
ncbi:carboxypeptidase regulatory-like domain-containing protein [Marinihelvus fidelis]|nr:carboxypeptidase regulatory-like domain-containing protein [Marinihelvus fidelis]